MVFSHPSHVQYESDLQKLKIERLRSFKAIEDYIEAFERKRTQDLRVRVLTSSQPVCISQTTGVLVYRDGHGLRPMAKAHHCFSFNMR